MSAKDLYDFEGIVEAAGKAVLEAQGLNAATTLEAPQFQKVRPRVEIRYTHGAGLNRFVAIVDGAVVTPETAAGLTAAQLFYARRETAWQCGLEFRLLTAADMAVHSEYRAEVRAALAQFWLLINGGVLTRHKLELGQDKGSSGVLVAPEEGIYRTDMSFSGSISVQQDAWAALVA